MDAIGGSHIGLGPWRDAHRGRGLTCAGVVYEYSHPLALLEHRDIGHLPGRIGRKGDHSLVWQGDSQSGGSPLLNPALRALPDVGATPDPGACSEGISAGTPTT